MNNIVGKADLIIAAVIGVVAIFISDHTLLAVALIYGGVFVVYNIIRSIYLQEDEEE